MKVPELRQRILFTLALIIIVRLGVHLPLPGVNVGLLSQFIKDQGAADGGLAGLGAILTIFSGGGLQNCGIFALGIMPYISASIMTQLLGAVVPQWQKMLREEGGRQKMTKWTRGIAIGIAAVQGWFLVKSLLNPSSLSFLSGIDKYNEALVLFPGPMFMVSSILIIVAGTMFLMWLGDQITERGIGNGVSLIISVNILHSLPGALAVAWKTLIYSDAGKVNAMGALSLVVLIAFLLVVIALVVTVTQAQRRIPVQYAKRVGVQKSFGGTATQYLPLKLNYSGVMPVIFATAIMSLPQVLIKTAWQGSWLDRVVSDWLNPEMYMYYVISGLMIFFFSYFWVATMFQPSQISEDLKRGGGYIPGVRPGPPTAAFLDQTMQRLTFSGSLFLALLFFLPPVLQTAGGVPVLVAQFFGGTSLLILVGVLLDMMKQIETTLLQNNYDGFLKKGKLRGRYNHLQGIGAAADKATVKTIWYVIIAVILIAVSIVAYVNS